jgi:hypothetical protein
MEWIASCGEAIGSALTVAVGHGCGFGMAHEACKLVADSWAAVQKIPFRCDPSEYGA